MAPKNIQFDLFEIQSIVSVTVSVTRSRLVLHAHDWCCLLCLTGKKRTPHTTRDTTHTNPNNERHALKNTPNDHHCQGTTPMSPARGVIILAETHRAKNHNHQCANTDKE